MAVVRNDVSGFTCGKRTNGARCILWDDATIGDDGFEWFTADEFSSLIGE